MVIDPSLPLLGDLDLSRYRRSDGGDRLRDLEDLERDLDLDRESVRDLEVDLDRDLQDGEQYRRSHFKLLL